MVTLCTNSECCTVQVREQESEMWSNVTPRPNVSWLKCVLCQKPIFPISVLWAGDNPFESPERTEVLTPCLKRRTQWGGDSHVLQQQAKRGGQKPDPLLIVLDIWTGTEGLILRCSLRHGSKYIVFVKNSSPVSVASTDFCEARLFDALWEVGVDSYGTPVRLTSVQGRRNENILHVLTEVWDSSVIWDTQLNNSVRGTLTETVHLIVSIPSCCGTN